jgi:2'-5' RNA ligase
MPEKTETSWRIFCAVELTEELKARVGEYSARLRAAFPAARASWERPEKLHLTIKFLGELEPSRVAELSEAAGRAATGLGEFPITIEGTGAFPPRGAPRVLWLGVGDSSGKLAELQRRLEAECAAAGFPRETRSFSPHLTIARLREPRGAQDLTTAHRHERFDALSFTARELKIVRSVLGPAGSRYTTVSSHPFSTI